MKKLSFILLSVPLLLWGLTYIDQNVEASPILQVKAVEVELASTPSIPGSPSIPPIPGTPPKPPAPRPTGQHS